MTLNEYVQEHSSQTDLARVLGVTQGLVYQWLNGLTKITAERAIDIERATAGAVTARELRPDLTAIFAPEASAKPAKTEEAA